MTEVVNMNMMYAGSINRSLHIKSCWLVCVVAEGEILALPSIKALKPYKHEILLESFNICFFPTTES